ncbi:MAG: tautomerase family protein [Bacteroidales bacterium]|nr:tautomerase family protein [Bacteroidales bacterium]
MPTIKIELQTGIDRPMLILLRDIVMDSVAGVLQLLPDDRNIRIIEYLPELFQMKKPYKVLIEISMFTGRSKETKKNLYKTITENIAASGIFDKENILIVLNEVPLQNWGVRGGIPADEVNLGFKVDV